MKKIYNILVYFRKKSSSAVFFFMLPFMASVCYAQSWRLTIVKSPSQIEYEEACEGFTSYFKKKNNHLFVLEDYLLEKKAEDQELLWQKIKKNNPSLIITVGTPATKSSIQHVQDIPVVFTMELGDLDGDSLKINSNNNSHLFGVTLSIPIEEQLKILKETLPEIRRVGLFYSKQFRKKYINAPVISKRLGIRLLSTEIEDIEDIPVYLRRIIPEIEVLWLPLDAKIYQRDVLTFILPECFSRNIPVIAYSKTLAIACAPIAIGVDYKDIGQQTAKFAEKILTMKDISQPQIETPRNTYLYLNERVVFAIGLHISSKAMKKAIIVRPGIE